MAETTPTKTTSQLPETVFAVDIPNHELLKLAYNAYLANGRENLAKTLRRGEVRGGGKKPWKQKGTGRARFGSSRNPIWRKGGVAFGPTGLENYKKRLSVGAKRTAIRQALSLADKAKKFIYVTAIPTTGKVRDMVAFLNENKATARRILLVVDQKTPELLRATNNIENVFVVLATYLNVYYILNADKIVMTAAAAKAVDEWLTYAHAEPVKGDKS